MLRAAKARDLDLICANPDIVVQFGDRMIWCAGAIARDYEAMGGKVIMAGKPFAPIYDLAYRELECMNREVEHKRVCSQSAMASAPTSRAQMRKGIDGLFIASGMHAENLLTGGVLDPAKVESVLEADSATARYAMRALR